MNSSHLTIARIAPQPYRTSACRPDNDSAPIPSSASLAAPTAAGMGKLPTLTAPVAVPMEWHHPPNTSKP